ncbi:MBL fold metallo-hydrolase [Nocardia sp. SYP-A9097]|uniref:MBL fold metallo-hydrolase n=1 Tax=Nocardia sp. SYP-A9097 TaxID=2663237 RepID=UPI00129BBEF7|nr:MBL fold metallo-hydrolase [Nocardia sp. SYP-A9097]MRH92145.1 MBL fold metallo-hydrolase [Nocardia sp. SYP-A9097]
MRIEQVSDSVFMVSGTNVNWALISNGSGVTVIDAGYPADTTAVLDSVRQIGHKVGDITAVLLTHAHLDHIGAIPTLVEQANAPVYTGALEVPHAKREHLQQITPRQMVQQLTTRQGARWVLQTTRAVIGHIDMRVPTAQAADPAVPAALPGGFVAISTPGHTDGHTAYFMPSEGVLFSGDELVTGHPLLPATGPQLLPKVFNHNQTRTNTNVDALSIEQANILVPGHGPAIHRHLPTLIAELRGPRD